MRDQSCEKRSLNIRLLLAAGIGASLEVFEFTLFGIFALQIGKAYFPSTDPNVAVIAAFASFALAYLGRPVGALIFGHIGDKRGRKVAMAASILIMSLSTTAVGAIPTYSRIGVVAPILLVVVRLTQGFAMAGEVTGVITFLTEYGDRKRRGLNAGLAVAFCFVGNIAGVLVALSLNHLLDEQAVAAWGWRIAFLLALPAGLIGLYLRMNFHDTPDFEKAKSDGELLRRPMRFALTTQWKMIALIAFLYAGQVASSHVISAYMPNYLEMTLGVQRNDALFAYVVTITACAIGSPLWGLIGDHIGHRRALLISYAALFLYSIPLFVGMRAFAHSPAILAMIEGGFGLVFGALAASMAMITMTAFPTNIRYSGSTVGYNLGITLFGGTFPLAASSLVHITGNVMVPAYYLACLVGCSLIATVLMSMPRNDTANLAPQPS